MSLGIGVMLAVLYSAGKLPAAIRPRNIFANLSTKIAAILFKNKRKVLSGSKPPWRLRSFRYYFISDDLKAK